MGPTSPINGQNIELEQQVIGANGAAQIQDNLDVREIDNRKMQTKMNSISQKVDSK